MKTCYFHVGHAKTGTSFLQSFMHLNDDLFSAAGIWVPWDYRHLDSWNCKQISEDNANYAGNFAPVFYSLVKKDKPNAIKILDHIFSCETDVLISTELIFYYVHLLREVVQYANLRGFSVTILAYLQRQDHAVVPSYYQNVRNHSYHKDTSSFLRENLAGGYFKYSDVLDLYRIASPNRVIARTFGPDYLTDRDLAADFVAALRLNIPLDTVKRSQRRTNPALPLETLELIRGLNCLGRQDLVEKVIAFAATNAQPNDSRRARDYYYTPEVAEITAKNFLCTNATLVENYFKDHSQSERLHWLKPPATPTGPILLDSRRIAEALTAILTPLS